MNIYYKSGFSGEEISLISYPFKMVTGDFLDYEWTYSKRNRRIVSFSKGIVEKRMTIFVYGRTKAEYAQNWKHIHDVFDRDIVEMTPGKLFFGHYYLSLYIFANQKTKWERGLMRCQNVFTAVSDRASWYRDKTYDYYPVGSQAESVFLDYPHDFPYDYITPNGGVDQIINDVVMPAQFRMIIYGPAANPYIMIGNHVYRVYTTVNDGELLIVDTRDRTVVRRTVGGTDINEFNNRDKESSVFASIPAGISQLIWPGSFGMKITLYQERSEPEWN